MSATLTAPAPCVCKKVPMSRAARSAARKWAHALDLLAAARVALHELADALIDVSPADREALMLEHDHVREDALGLAWTLSATTGLLECESPPEVTHLTLAYRARQARLARES